MQYITRNTTNTLFFTLTERVTLSNPYFLFEFKCDSTRVTKYCIMANTSNYTSRYDKFSLIENTTENPTAGQISLYEAGQYSYRVWEQSSSSNLNPANAGTLLESGIVVVRESSQTYIEHQPSTIEYISYGNG